MCFYARECVFIQIRRVLLDSKRVGSAPGSLEQQSPSSVRAVMIFSPLFAATSVYTTAAALRGRIQSPSSESLVSESEGLWSSSGPVCTASRTNVLFAMSAAFIGTRAAFAQLASRKAKACASTAFCVVRFAHMLRRYSDSLTKSASIARFSADWLIADADMCSASVLPCAAHCASCAVDAASGSGAAAAAGRGAAACGADAAFFAKNCRMRARLRSRAAASSTSPPRRAHDVLVAWAAPRLASDESMLQALSITTTCAPCSGTASAAAACCSRSEVCVRRGVGVQTSARCAVARVPRAGWHLQHFVLQVHPGSHTVGSAFLCGARYRGTHVSPGRARSLCPRAACPAGGYARTLPRNAADQQTSRPTGIARAATRGAPPVDAPLVCRRRAADSAGTSGEGGGGNWARNTVVGREGTFQSVTKYRMRACITLERAASNEHPKDVADPRSPPRTAEVRQTRQQVRADQA